MTCCALWQTLLAWAVQVELLTLMASCGSKEGSDMAEMFHVHIDAAAQQRYQLLVTTLGAAPGKDDWPAPAVAVLMLATSPFAVRVVMPMVPAQVYESSTGESPFKFKW